MVAAAAVPGRKGMRGLVLALRKEGDKGEDVVEIVGRV